MRIERIAPGGHRGGASPGATQAVRVGDLVFVGGQMSLDGNGRVIGADLATQAKNAFDALKRVLAAAGLADIRAEFYPEPGPAYTGVGVSGFAFAGLLVEVEVIAVTRGQTS